MVCAHRCARPETGNAPEWEPAAPRGTENPAAQTTRRLLSVSEDGPIRQRHRVRLHGWKIWPVQNPTVGRRPDPQHRDAGVSRKSARPLPGCLLHAAAGLRFGKPGAGDGARRIALRARHRPWLGRPRWQALRLAAADLDPPNAVRSPRHARPAEWF